MTAWLDQQERGSATLMRVIAQLSLRLGRPVGRLLLYPICGYFFLCSGRARRASAEYLALALGRPARIRDVLRHYHTFASVVLDRIFFVTGRFQRYQIAVRGEAVLEDLAAAGRGAILLSAHYGSFDALRALARLRAGLDVKILMYRANSRRITAAFDSLNPTLAQSIIDLGQPSALLRVKEVVDGGGFVGVLGDRYRGREKTVPVDFLGRTAWLPVGPLMMAAALKVPVVLVFGIYRGSRRYAIEIEPFAERIALDRRSDAAMVAAVLQRYGAAVEAHCREAPFNWFNFFDFWQRPTHD
jgi:predicted LPLAT superfamily acyltransferase